MKRVIQSTQEKNAGKLEPNWESLYTMVARGGEGSYTLAGQDRKTLDKQWSFFYLNRYSIWSSNTFNEKIYYAFAFLNEHFSSVQSPLDSSSDGPSRALTLTFFLTAYLMATPTMDALLKNGGAPSSQIQPTMDTILKDEGAPSGQTRPTLDALLKYWDAPTVKFDPQWMLSWKMETILMVKLDPWWTLSWNMETILTVKLDSR